MVVAVPSRPRVRSPAAGPTVRVVAGSVWCLFRKAATIGCRTRSANGVDGSSRRSSTRQRAVTRSSKAPPPRKEPRSGRPRVATYAGQSRGRAARWALCDELGKGGIASARWEAGCRLVAYRLLNCGSLHSHLGDKLPSESVEDRRCWIMLRLAMFDWSPYVKTPTAIRANAVLPRRAAERHADTGRRTTAPSRGARREPARALGASRSPLRCCDAAGTVPLAHDRSGSASLLGRSSCPTARRPPAPRRPLPGPLRRRAR
jgi:hypothetical protein